MHILSTSTTLHKVLTLIDSALYTRTSDMAKTHWMVPVEMPLRPSPPHTYIRPGNHAPPLTQCTCEGAKMRLCVNLTME
jgi:hypothetical protein